MNALPESLFQIFDQKTNYEDFKPETRAVAFLDGARPKLHTVPVVPNHVEMVVFSRTYKRLIRPTDNAIHRPIICLYAGRPSRLDAKALKNVRYYSILPGEDMMMTLKRLYLEFSSCIKRSYNLDDLSEPSCPIERTDDVPSHQEYRDAVTESVNRYVKDTSRSAIDKIMNQRDLVLCSEISLARYVKSKETAEELRELFSKSVPKEHMHVVKNLTGCYELVLAPDLL